MHRQRRLALVQTACFALALAGVLQAQPPASAGAQKPDPLERLKGVGSPVPGAETLELDVGGAKAFIVKPVTPRPDGSKPWVWYAPSLAADDGGWTLPSERHFGVMRPLLEKGFYFCGVDVGESYGSPAGRAKFTEFHRLLTGRYGFPPKACLFPVSRGGLMHYNWAAEHPECVRCVGAIYPVCNLRAYPGLAKLSRAYGMSEEQLRNQVGRHNPLDRLAPLAAAKVPILHLHGDRDTVVPLESNSAELARRYAALGGDAEIVVIRGKGHETAPEFWREPRLAEFFLKHGGN
jgi:pimeloyl-ACP methyl ester carboxylesterase